MGKDKVMADFAFLAIAFNIKKLISLCLFAAQKGFIGSLYGSLGALWTLWGRKFPYIAFRPEEDCVTIINATEEGV